MKYKFYVTDWSPNGTNALIVRDAKTYEQVDCRDEVLFGVDVAKLGPPQYFGTDFVTHEEYRISKKLIKKHVAASPVSGEFEDNCKWLTKYLETA